VFAFHLWKAGHGDGRRILTALMSATMAAAFFYYAGFRLLCEFGLPSHTTMVEFHEFMTGRSEDTSGSDVTTTDQA
jgi:hypothetical protein